jgi:hypothetical protein
MPRLNDQTISSKLVLPTQSIKMQDNESYQLSLDLPSETASWSKQVCRAKRSMRSGDSLDKVRHVQSTRKYHNAASAMPKRKKALAASITHPLVVTLEPSGHSRTDSVGSKSSCGKSFDSLPINLIRQSKRFQESINSLTKVEFTNELEGFPIEELSELPMDPTVASLEESNHTRPASYKAETLETSPKSVMKQSLQKPSQTSENNIQKSPQSSKDLLSSYEYHSATPNMSPPSVKQPCVLEKSPHFSTTKTACMSPVPSEIAVMLEGTTENLPSGSASQGSGSKKKSSLKNSGCSASAGSSTLRRSQENPNAVERFLSHEQSLKDQVDSLTQRERNCFAILRQQWDADHQPMPGHMYIRFARHCRFDIREGRKLLSKFNDRYLNLTAAALEPQLLTRVSKVN